LYIVLGTLGKSLLPLDNRRSNRPVANAVFSSHAPRVLISKNDGRPQFESRRAGL
jgi:hypothetical protein